MKIFNDIECIYSYGDKNDELKGEKSKCKIVLDKGTISFLVKEVEEQFLIEEEILKQALINNQRVETNGVYKHVNKENIPSFQCKVNINIMPLTTNFYVVDCDNAIGISNFNLKRILDIKQ